MSGFHRDDEENYRKINYKDLWIGDRYCFDSFENENITWFTRRIFFDMIVNITDLKGSIIYYG